MEGFMSKYGDIRLDRYAKKGCGRSGKASKKEGPRRGGKGAGREEDQGRRHGSGKG